MLQFPFWNKVSIEKMDVSVLAIKKQDTRLHYNNKRRNRKKNKVENMKTVRYNMIQYAEVDYEKM